MPLWLNILTIASIILGIAGSAYLMHLVAEAKKRGDLAPGWIIECKTCNTWRPATEVGIVRLKAVGTKTTLARCATCDKLRASTIRKGPGEVGKRRIDERSLPHIWPETLPDSLPQT